MPKNAQTAVQLHSSHTLVILTSPPCQNSPSQGSTICELPDVQAGFRQGRGTRDQIANICWIMEKARVPEKTSISALLTMPKPFTLWITINCGKF